MRWWDYLLLSVGFVSMYMGFGLLLFVRTWPPKQVCTENNQHPNFHLITVTHKYLTGYNYCITVIDMANALDTDKQIVLIAHCLKVPVFAL
jgi:hypothetical protein